MIKTYGHKEHQPKNKNLFEIVITLNKQKKVIQFIKINPKLKNKIEKKKLKAIEGP